MFNKVQKFDEEMQELATQLNLLGIDLLQGKITQEAHDKAVSEIQTTWHQRLQSPEAAPWDKRMKELKDEMAIETKKER
jgi:hypothetical protein